MFTEFFHKRRIMRFACGLAFLIAFSCIAYAYFLSTVKVVEWKEYFYFLVSEDTSLEAGTEFVKWSGGAGYLMEEGDCVAYTCFSDRAQGETVQKRLKNEGKLTKLLQKEVEKLYFKGKEKKRANLYVGALKLLKSYILLLEDCIGRLENGMTQAVCKGILKTIERQFLFAKESYSTYASFTKICAQSAESFRQIGAKTVYAKDLRYLLCWQTEKYLQLCHNFTL